MANVRKAGGLILAKTNTSEFGAGGNTTNRVYGPTGNPFDAAKLSVSTVFVAALRTTHSDQTAIRGLDFLSD